jgi:hypothetical protein
VVSDEWVEIVVVMSDILTLDLLPHRLWLRLNPLQDPAAVGEFWSKYIPKRA